MSELDTSIFATGQGNGIANRIILLRSGRRASTTMSLFLTLPKSWFV